MDALDPEGYECDGCGEWFPKPGDLRAVEIVDDCPGKGLMEDLCHNCYHNNTRTKR